MALNIEVDHTSIAEFCRRNHVARLSFFGAALRDDSTSESDVDVVAAFEASCMPSLFGMAHAA
jgi:predicted nucleotidyltransferase